MTSPPGRRGYYEGTDKEGGLWRIPRNVDPAIDKTSLAEHHPNRFDMKHAPDSVSLDDFDESLEITVPGDVLARIDHTIEAGLLLAKRGLADSPPVDERAWRRGIVLSWCHARDLVVVHDAIGHPRAAIGHDMDELALAKRLKERIAPDSDHWYRDYVETLDEGAWVNVGFFNPHISASMFKWGDIRGGVQNAMDAHRLAAHHQGTPERPLDWVERAVNFVVHHIPREHWGIRHEPRGNWSDLELRLAEDPAIKDAEIGKVIARDAAKLFELLELEGKVVPWHLLKVPKEALTPSMIEHAHLLVLAADRLVAAGEADVFDSDEDEARNPHRVQRARELLARVPAEIDAARSQGRDKLLRAYSQWLEGHA
jgi:hypothetical protein